MNEATNWSWIRQLLRHLPPPVLLGWLLSLRYGLSRRFGPKTKVSGDSADGKDPFRSGLPEQAGEDADEGPVELANGRFAVFRRKMREESLFWGIACIGVHGVLASPASSLGPGRQAEPPWLPPSSS